jgi:TetR/AcrR family transcriptional repressor of bet genes
MATRSLTKIRRLELQKAAYEVAYKVGLNSTTVEQVARHAGTSKGLVHAYFDSKHQLLEYAMRYAYGILGRAAGAKLKNAKTPSGRVWAIVEANFLPEILTPEFFRLWFEAVDNKRLSYVLGVFDRRMRSNMLHALKQLADSGDAGELAYSIMNFYDGLWVLASTEKGLTREAALSLIAEYIKELIPEFDIGVTRFAELPPQAFLER